MSTNESGDMIDDKMMAMLLALQAYDQANTLMIFALANQLGGADLAGLNEMHQQLRKQAIDDLLRKWEDRNPAIAARIQEQFSFLDGQK